MNKGLKIFIVLFLTLAVVSQGLIINPPKAEAQFGDISDIGGMIGSILGYGVALWGVCEGWTRLIGLIPETPSISLDPSKVPVQDPSHIKATKRKVEKTDCMSFAKGFLLDHLKTRLLDMLVDSMVDWIQTGGEPRFITNFGDYLGQATDAAIGDTVEGIGLGDLCYNIGYNLGLGIRRIPRFSERISCTLGDIQNNLEDFADDFSEGGWIGYQRLLEPQNNPFGLRVLTVSNYYREKSERSAEKEGEIKSGAGSLGQRRCTLWQEIYDADDPEPQETEAGEDYWFESPDGDPYTGRTNRPGEGDWKCIQSEIITPATVMGDLVTKTIGSDIDFIVDAEDLRAYATAISQAIFNRIATETAGLLGDLTALAQGGPTTATPPTGTSGSLTQELIAQVKQELRNALIGIENQLDSVINNLNQAENLNDQLIDTLTALIQCQDTTGQTFDPQAQHHLNEAQTRAGTIDDVRIEVNSQLRPEVNSLRSDIDSASTSGELSDISDQINNLTSNVQVLSSRVNNLLSEAQSELPSAINDLNSCENEL